MTSNPNGEANLSTDAGTSPVQKLNAFDALVDKLPRLLASLTLTVVLMAMAIFIVLAGTMAQVDKGIWQVTDEYFRTAVAWIDFSIFFPSHWFPNLPHIPGGFYFPGGWLIGAVMAINLLTAHTLRFRIQTRGTRMTAGIVLLVIGALMTWAVIAGGSSAGNAGSEGLVGSSTLRLILQWGLGIVWLACIFALFKLDRARKGEWLLALIACLVLGGAFGWTAFGGERAMLNDSSLRILWQLIKGEAASLVLLGGCAVLFQKRAGIVLIHAGVGLLMLSELLVGTQAVEGHMRIEEGKTVNYVEEDRHYELAVIDRSDPQDDEVFVVPESQLKDGQMISRKYLPFDITVVAYFPNSIVRAVDTTKPNLATAGLGLMRTAIDEKPVSGTDSKINMPSAYLRLTRKGSAESLGTYLVALTHSYQGIVESIRVGGHQYDVSLRFKRTYKPYSIRLEDFRHDTYLGTNKARNFSSDIHLMDPSRGEDRKVRIWMNNPMRYAGETFYQSGYDKSTTTGAQITILQVVSNRGWMIPYVACMVAGTGMLAHFWIVLIRFLRWRTETRRLESENGMVRSKHRLPLASSVFVPLVVVLLAALFMISVALPPKASENQMNLYEFGKLPVAYGGRVKPFDTLARNSLSILSKKQTFKNASNETEPAIRWLLDVMTDSENSTEHAIFRIEDLDVLRTLRLNRHKGLRYAFKDFYYNPKEFYRQVEMARSQSQEEMSSYQKRILQLDTQIQFFRLLEESFRKVQVRAGHEREDLSAAMKKAELLASFQPPLAIPDIIESGDASVDESPRAPWHTFTSAWAAAQNRQLQGEKPNPAALAFGNILDAYVVDDVDRFNQAIDEYRLILREHPAFEYNRVKTDFEAFFNHCQPFLWLAFLYVFAFILTALAWLGWSQPLNRSGFWLILLTLAFHTVAIIARIYISGRPPVTNLYSSAVFIGWASVLLGVVLEWIYGMGVGNVLASVAGFLSLMVAFFLSRSGDTFDVLQAVLDTQFWLATHVVCITLGYSTTFIAGFLGIVYVVRGVCTPSLSRPVSMELSRMIYGTLCFSIFFSFIGTVLGGLWADDSWGRFWGWDPKENGALIIVLWNILVLHAWRGGLASERGLALLAVGGNICTTWSWFGTNELGVGLHSYGFTEGVLLALGLFCATQLAIIGMGLLPQKLWWSARAAAEHKTTEKPGGRRSS